MTPLANNGAPGYRVICPAIRLQELKDMQSSLSDAAAIRRFIAALRTINARLRKDPLVFGEPRNHLSNLRLAVRAAAVAPLFVSYGVHEDLPLVFVRQFLLLGS